MPKHTVAQGECIASIAFDSGFFWSTVWQAPENEALRSERKNPNTLVPGDEVFIPEKRAATQPCATGARHQFRLKGIPAKLRLKILSGGQPRANEPFVIDIDGAQTRGTTGAAGEIEVFILPDAASAKLTVGEGEDATEYVLRLRELRPAADGDGVQQRLANLGYSGPPKSALQAFQRDHNLTETGEADEATLAAIQSAHGV